MMYLALIYWAGVMVLGCGLLLAVIFSTLADAAESEGTNFQIRWTIPDKYEDGREMPRSQITGYDIYVRVNGGNDEYLAWVPNKGDVTSYNFILTDAGRYCYQMRTVTLDFGKSQRTGAVCIDYEEKQPVPIFSYPIPPTNLKVEEIVLP